MFSPEDFENDEKVQMQQETSEEIVPAQDNRYHNFLLRYTENVLGSIGPEFEEYFTVINELYAVVYYLAKSEDDVELTNYSYNGIPKCYTYMDIQALQASGVTRLHDHPYLGLRGKNTIVAVIDSGIDYRHPVFREGNSSKILEIWDQAVPGRRNERVPYGEIYSKEQIDRALESENPLEIVPVTDEKGHGTMLAGIAAGYKIAGEEFSGAAPEANLLIIKLKPAKPYLRNFFLYPPDVDLFQEDDIMLAISYAREFARKMQMPLSICIGLGSSKGSHEGYSPLSQTIDFEVGISSSAVTSAGGNEGAARHHYMGLLEQSRPADTAELRVGEKTERFAMEFWGNSPELFSLTLESPTGEALEISRVIQNTTQELRFVFVDTRVLVNYISIERYTGKTLVFFRFFHPAPGIWRFHISGRDARESQFHMWLPVTGAIPGDTFFLESSPYQTITTPGTAQGGMTMTAYQYRDGSLFVQASRGFSPGGAVKPDFAAPGVELRVPLPGGGYGLASGTSLAAAQTSGIAALLLEWALNRGNQPYFTGNNVKNYLQRGARREEGLQYPNPEWGYGKIDLYRSFELL